MTVQNDTPTTSAGAPTTDGVVLERIPYPRLYGRIIPAADGSRPGVHWLNTSAPDTRTRYEYEALAFHENASQLAMIQQQIQQTLGAAPTGQPIGTEAFLRGLDPRDSEAALGMLQWLIDTGRLQVIELSSQQRA